MARVPHGLLAGLAIAALAAATPSPARGAELTELATAAEPGNPFDLRFTIRWDRAQEQATIRRELASTTENPPFGGIVDAAELDYERTRNTLVTRVGVGLYEDLELAVDVPYVLSDDHAWKYALENGIPVGPNSSIGGSNDPNVDAMNRACTGDCQLFPVGDGQTVYQGGKLGDLKVGLAWAAFSQRKDDTKPTWVIGFEATLPTAARYDPAGGRDAEWRSPHADSGKTGSFGEKVWKWDLHTAVSRRMGAFDPYFKAHFTWMRKSNATWSNCDGAGTYLGTRDGGSGPRVNSEMTIAGAENCASGSWDGEAGAKLPYVTGLLFGAEIVPRENRRAEQKLAIDVRLWADYVSRQRFYNELTDLSGRLHWTEPYYTMGGLLGFYFKASRNVSLHASASLAASTPHFLTGERLGRDGVEAGDTTGETSNPDLNPNYDWRYDAPGRRFRLTDTSVFAMSVGGVLRF
jgi:hypothetical protein